MKIRSMHVQRSFLRWKSFQTLTKQTSGLNDVVSKAEKIVGYPTSFLNLRWLLTDELANIALQLRKLIGTNHPLLETARKLFTGNSLPAWGLIILLVSKASGLNSEFSINEKDNIPGVLHSQRALAEITEMIRTANVLHRNVLNTDESSKKKELESSFGNKIALLSGDYLLSRSVLELSFLKNQKLVELMSSAVRDLSEAEFIGPRDSQDKPLPYKPTNIHTNIRVVDQFGTEAYNSNEVLGNPRAEWTVRNILGGANLLGRACQGTLMLANHSEEIQNLGYSFGKNVALACRVQTEMQEFIDSSVFSLVSAPVMLHLEYDPTSYEKIGKGQKNVLDVDYDELRKTVQRGSGLEKTHDMQREILSNALDLLCKFPPSDARSVLENILKAML